MIDIYNLKKDELLDLIETNKKAQTDSYIIKNRGYLTASMIKEFEKSTESFFIKYILEHNVNNDDTPSLKLGTIVDDYISYGKDKFYEKYYIDEGLLKPELVAKLQELLLDFTGTVDVLKSRLYEGKEKITPAEWLKVKGILNEWDRQGIFDIDGGYETQKELIVEYKGLKLKATLDRISTEKGLLRDMKTTNNIKKFNFQVGDYGYDFSMSFYNILCKIEYNKDFIVILDICQTTSPYPSSSMVIPPETIVSVGECRIMPQLNKLSGLMSKWEKTKNPNIWVEEEAIRENLYNLDTYPYLKTSLQSECEIFQ